MGEEGLVQEMDLRDDVRQVFTIIRRIGTPGANKGIIGIYRDELAAYSSITYGLSGTGLRRELLPTFGS